MTYTNGTGIFSLTDRLSAAAKADIDERLRAGESLSGLAAEFGVARTAIRRIRDGGVVGRLSDEERSDIVARLRKDEDASVLAMELGVSVGVVRKLRDRAIAKDVPTHGGFVQARLSIKELEALDALVEASGTTKSALVRRMVRLASGVVDYQETEVEAVREATRQLTRVGQNLARMLQLAQSGRFKWGARDQKTVEELVKHQSLLIRKLQALHRSAARQSFVDALELGQAVDDVA